MKVTIDVLFNPYSHPHSQSLIRRMVLIYLNKLNDITHIYFKKIQTTLQTNILCQTGLVHRHVASVYKKGGGGQTHPKKNWTKKKRNSQNHDEKPSPCGRNSFKKSIQADELVPSKHNSVQR